MHRACMSGSRKCNEIGNSDSEFDCLAISHLGRKSIPERTIRLQRKVLETAVKIRKSIQEVTKLYLLIIIENSYQVFYVGLHCNQCNHCYVFAVIANKLTESNFLIGCYFYRVKRHLKQ